MRALPPASAAPPPAGEDVVGDRKGFLAASSKLNPHASIIVSSCSSSVVA
jgi:hypothetical protein